MLILALEIGHSFLQRDVETHTHTHTASTQLTLVC